jgi:hypothetical protein
MLHISRELQTELYYSSAQNPPQSAFCTAYSLRHQIVTPEQERIALGCLLLLQKPFARNLPRLVQPEIGISRIN